MFYYGLRLYGYMESAIMLINVMGLSLSRL